MNIWKAESITEWGRMTEMIFKEREFDFSIFLGIQTKFAVHLTVIIKNLGTNSN